MRRENATEANPRPRQGSYPQSSGISPKQMRTFIEESFQPYLSSLRSGNLDFISNDADAVFFYRGLAVQYMRTNHRRRIELMMSVENRARYERTANILTHILAVNIGYSLFNDHPRLTLVLIDNHTNVPFVTADQPVINIAAKLKEFTAPSTFEATTPSLQRELCSSWSQTATFYPETHPSRKQKHICGI
jgi:hypothetical protein